MTDQPGLNPAALRALRATRHDQDQITTRIAHHLETHDGYLALSGGKDSVAGDAIIYAKIDGKLIRTTPAGLRAQLSFRDVQASTNGQFIARATERVELLTASARTHRNAEAVWSPMAYIMWHHIEEPLYEVSLTNGRRLRVSGDHSLMLARGRGSIVRPARAKEANPGDSMFALVHIPTTPNSCEHLPVPDWLSYLAGLWTADGAYAQDRRLVIATGNNPDIIQFLGTIPRPRTATELARNELDRLKVGSTLTLALRREIASRIGVSETAVHNAHYRKPRRVHDVLRPRITDRGDVWLSCRELVVQLQALGFRGTCRTKRIPSWLFTAPQATVASFLAGYFDGDGWWNPRSGLGVGGVNRPLLEDVRELLWRLGVKHGVSTRKVTGGYKPHEVTTLTINSRAGLLRAQERLPFRRLRAADTWTHREGKIRRDFQMVGVTGVKRLEATPQTVYDFETGNGMFIADGLLIHNSLVTLDLARQVDPHLPVVYFDSGLEYPETYAYLDHLRHIWRLNLTVIDASTPLLTILITNGSWDHRAPEFRTPDLHQALIADPARQAHTLHGPGELWGVRAAESAGRRAAYATALLANLCSCCTDRTTRAARHGGVISRADGTTAYGPIWNWTDDQVWAHINRRELPLNPVYDKLRAMGAPPSALRISHLLDADHLDRGRAVWLKRGWPDLYERLHELLPRISEHL